MASSRFIHDERGAVAVIGAVGMMMTVGFCALAIDLGSVFLDSRRLQGTADLAAMAAARDLDNAQAAATATVDANSEPGAVTVAVVKGQYATALDTRPDQRFQETPNDPNAARVQLTTQTKLFFGAMLTGKPTWTISRQATAARADLASFSIGTRLASLNGGVANALLGALTGSRVNLSVMDYQALATTDINLFEYLEAVKTELHLTAASYDSVLNAEITTGQALSALSAVLDDPAQGIASRAAKAVANSAGGGAKLRLSQLFDLGPYGPQSHVANINSASVAISALDLTTAALRLASHERQLQLDLGASVPGLADLEVWMAIGEPPNKSPWMTITSSREVVIRTAQTRLYLAAKVGGSGLLSAAEIKIPLFVEAASGEAKLNTLDCRGRTAVLDVRPGLASLVIGEVDPGKLGDFKRTINPATATLVRALVFKVTGGANVKVGGLAWTPVTFTEGEAKSGVVKTVATRDIANATVSSLLKSLSLDVEVPILGLGLGLVDRGGLLGALGGLLSTVATPLDNTLNTLTDLLGVGLGEADVRLNGLRCRDAALVA